jgi:hypothetical protein
MSQGAKDAEHLVELRFLKDITADHQEQIRKTEEESGRTWKVYEVTCLGRALFQAFTSLLVN